MPTIIGGISHRSFSSCSTTNNDLLWTNWNWQYQTQFSGNIWQQWIIAPIAGPGGSGILSVTEQGLTSLGQDRPSVEQLAAQTEREVRRRTATIRARALLDDALTAEQRRELADHRYITVESAGSKRRYRIRCDQGRHGNIVELDAAGVEIASLCVAPNGDLPLDDALLGQLLFLRHDEDALRRAANITAFRRSA